MAWGPLLPLLGGQAEKSSGIGAAPGTWGRVGPAGDMAEVSLGHRQDLI